jgi:hypothetical protein
MSFPPAAPFPGVPKSDFSVFKSSSGPHGSDEPWVALTVGGAYTLVFRGLAGEDRWFVRTDEYAGVCAALAFEHELVIPPGGSLSRDLRVLVADGVLAPEQISDR